jgi:GTPase
MLATAMDWDATAMREVRLFLNEKHRAGWDEEAARLRAIGLQDPG